MRTILSVALLFALSLFAFFTARPTQTGSAQTEQTRVPMKTNEVALQLTFGLKDAEPADWSGRLKLSAGRLERLEARPQANDRIEGDSWRLRSRRQGQGANARINPAQLFAVFDAPPDAKVEVTTGGRGFSFTLGELPFCQKNQFFEFAGPVESVAPFWSGTQQV